MTLEEHVSCLKTWISVTWMFSLVSCMWIMPHWGDESLFSWFTFTYCIPFNTVPLHVHVCQWLYRNIQRVKEKHSTVFYLLVSFFNKISVNVHFVLTVLSGTFSNMTFVNNKVSTSEKCLLNSLNQTISWCVHMICSILLHYFSLLLLLEKA